MSAGCTSEAHEPSPAVHPLDRLPEDAAGDVVRRAIARAAGGDAWPAHETVEYTKTTTRFDEDGDVTGTFVERHRYVLAERPRIRIERRTDEGEILLINNGEQAWKFVDGEPATRREDRDHAWNATFGSHYVFWMPFKLADHGTMMEYAGRAEQEDGSLWDEVIVTYEPGAGSAGGMHTWRYFFAEDGTLAANHLQFGPEEFSFTEYHDYARIHGVSLPALRIGYRSNAAKERLYKVSEIRYDDVRFNVPLGDSLFAPETALEGGAKYSGGG